MSILTKTIRAAAIALIAGTLCTGTLCATAGTAYADAPTPSASDTSSDKIGFSGGFSANGDTYTGIYAVPDAGYNGVAANNAAAGGKRASKAKPKAPEPPPGPDTCGIVVIAGVQRCQCSTSTGPMILDYGECQTQPAKAKTPPPPSQVEVLATVRQVGNALPIPEGTPQVAPDPAANEWNMIPVGFPIWLTTTAPDTAGPTSQTQDGITMTFTAVRLSTTFEMGEAKVKNSTVSCTKMTVRWQNMYPLNRPSPTCGYTYVHQGVYTIKATTTWRLTWTANGQTGTVDTTRTAEAPLPLTIGQLRSVIVSVGP